MEIFRDLYISSEPDRMAEVAERIDRAPPAGWSRDRVAEDRARSAPVLKRRPTFCFSCTAEGRRPAAMLMLTQKDAGYTGAGGVTASLSDGRAELEHWMSHETANLLRRFSTSANRSTGSAHPVDQDRWNAFVLAAHRDGCRMDAADLGRWLIEVDGWPPEVAMRLANEYEYGRELLAYAEGRRSA